MQVFSKGIEITLISPAGKQSLSSVPKNVLDKSHTANVTSTSQHQIFDEKFDQEPENVRIKMADLAGR